MSSSVKAAASAAPADSGAAGAEARTDVPNTQPLAARSARLSAWGRDDGSVSLLHHAESAAALAEKLTSAGPRGAIARGLGRSCSDSAANGGGGTIRLAAPERGQAVEWVDWERRVARLNAAASLADVSRELLARGWYLPVAGRTAHVSVGGAIAADLHGSSHWQRGTLAANTVRIELMDSGGTVYAVGPAGQGGEIFWATAGGMGLTGVILAIEVNVIAVTSAWLTVDTRRYDTHDELLHALASAAKEYPYVTARLDTAASGPALGRGVVSSARHASVGVLPANRRPAALEFESSPEQRRARRLPHRLIGARTSRALHSSWFRSSPAARDDELQPIASYFHTDDATGGWFGWRGAAGLLQYSAAIPESATGLIASLLAQLQAIGAVSANASLLRLGSHRHGHLSFPVAGWAISLDLPAAVFGLGRVLDQFDEQLASAGGRVFLASDLRVRPELLAAMYPRLPDWLALRRQIDPQARLQSDMQRRLRL